MNHQHHISHIKEVLQSFHPLKEESLNQLLDLVQIKPYKKGEYFQKEYTPAINIGILIQGALMVRRFEEDGTENVVYFNTPDKTPFVGVLESLIKQEDSITQIQAFTESYIGSIKYQDLQNLYSTNIEINSLGRKLIEHHYLIALEQGRYRKSNDDKKKFLILLEKHPIVLELCKKQDVANYIGCTPPSFTRLLKTIEHSENLPFGKSS
jgi:CRP-like cAMP-binding protein